MITLALILIGFLSGIYVGVRWAERLRDIWHSITGK